MKNPVIENTLLTLGEDYLDIWLKTFVQAKQSENVSKKTLSFYEFTLKGFGDYANAQAVKSISQITPTLIREYLLHLEERKHNSGGIHAHFRALKTFMLWYWNEVEPSCPNPIKKVKSPKLIQPAIQGVTPEQFELLVSACNTKRDKLILYILMDTGIRANELVNIQLKDVNLIQSSIFIEKGKGRKPRFCFIGQKARRQVRRYLKERKSDSPYLFTNCSGEKMVFQTLREVLRRLGTKTGLVGITAHDFRRAFCLAQLNAGCDLVTLSRLMGHTSIVLLSRYAFQSTTDIQSKYKSILDNN